MFLYLLVTPMEAMLMALVIKLALNVMPETKIESKPVGWRVDSPSVPRMQREPN